MSRGGRANPERQSDVRSFLPPQHKHDKLKLNNPSCSLRCCACHQGLLLHEEHFSRHAAAALGAAVP